jgi:hypothetical protein
MSELAKAGAAPRPTPGRIVHYRLSAHDVEQITRRRTDSRSIAARIDTKEWPLGAQAHVGNPPVEGDYVPMLIVRTWDGSPSVNGQAFLDGNDVLWLTSKLEGTEPGTWTWPPRS